MQKIVLASKSPRRKQLLEWAEIDFEVLAVDTDESFPVDMAIEEVPVFIARQKAEAVKSRVAEDRIILAADTIVVLDKAIIGKPSNRQHAVEILTAISGKKHLVITGVVILHGQREMAFSDITEVYFHELTLSQIEFYIDKYQPYDKAGAYAIQEWIGVTGIESIHGDFYNVMGLPVSRVVRQIRSLLNHQ